MPPIIDAGQFTPGAAKRLQVACDARRRGPEAAYIRDAFQAAHPAWADLPWVALDGLDDAATTAALAASAVYLALGRLEGFNVGLLAAMAAGCVPAGFTGMVANELALDDAGCWAREDDCPAAAVALGRAMAVVAAGGDRWLAMQARGEALAGGYARDRMVSGLVGFWRARLARQEVQGSLLGP